MLPVRYVLDDDVCPIRDELLAAFYGASELSMPGLLAAAPPETKVMPAPSVSVIALSVNMYHCGRSQRAEKLYGAQLNEVVKWSSTVTPQVAGSPFEHGTVIPLQS